MAETDFTLFGADAATIKRGVTAGIQPPNGGGNFVFGFNSQVASKQAVGLYHNQGDFSPLVDGSSNPTGCSVRGVLQRGVSTAPVGFATGLFGCLQGASAPTISDVGYILSLADNDPSEIRLIKGTPLSMVSLAADSTTILRSSSANYLWGTWLQLRLDVIVNPNGDVILRCFQSDLNTYPVSNPNWQPISGMDDFVDDALGINSNSNPLAGGWGGWCFAASIDGGRGFVDHFELHRQA